MQKRIGAILLGALAMILLSAIPAQAWNCSDPLAERVDVGPTLPAGATMGDGDGQYYKGSDAANPNDYYVCEVVNPKQKGGGGGSTSNSNTNTNQNTSSSSSNSNSTSGATSQSGSSATASGGRSQSTSTATGGNATGGNASSGVSGSGNSTVNNNTSATGGAGGAGGSGGNATASGGNQKQQQSQSLNNSGNSTASASNNGNGNGNGSNNASYSSTTNIAASKIPVNTALAVPVVPTAPCFKGYSGAAQTAPFGVSFGAGKVDQNCQALETARVMAGLGFQQNGCLIVLTTKAAKEAGLTAADCVLATPPVVEAAPAPVIEKAAPQVVVNVPPIVVNVPSQPAPVVNMIIPEPPKPTVTVHAVKKKPRSCSTLPPCPATKPTVFTDDGQGHIRKEYQEQ